MADLVQRPRFYEGQVLAAVDLTAGLEYARSQEARHDRLVHRWGIVDGLTLAATPQTSGSAKYVTVSLQPGLAIDGTGREVLVPEAMTLDAQLFARSNVAVGDAGAWYPVLLAGADRPSLPPPVSHSCTVAQASRTVESYKITFGAPGDELRLDAQKPPPVWAGAGGAPDAPRWWLLLGFVQWDAAQKHFTAAGEAANGVARRYVGVRADEVTAQGGDLVLRSRPDGTPGAAVWTVHSQKDSARVSLDVDDGEGGHVPMVAAYSDGTIETHAGQATLRSGARGIVGKPMVQLAETDDGGTLTFGLQTAAGKPSSLLAVDEQGNLSIAGIFKGQLAHGVRLESGTASNGMVLPLPDGITDEQVQSGAVRLHFQLMPQPAGLAPWDADLTTYPAWIAMPQEASVDPTTRELRCLVRWIGFHQQTHAPTTETVAGACDYVVFAVTQES